MCLVIIIKLKNVVVQAVIRTTAFVARRIHFRWQDATFTSGLRYAIRLPTRPLQRTCRALWREIIMTTAECAHAAVAAMVVYVSRATWCLVLVLRPSIKT